MKIKYFIFIGLFFVSLAVIGFSEECQIANPQFGTVKCEGSTPTTYEYVDKQFGSSIHSEGWNYSSVSFNCITDDCKLELQTDIIDPLGKGLTQGDSFCNAGEVLYIDIYKGNSVVATRRTVTNTLPQILPLTFDRSNPLRVDMYCFTFVGKNHPVKQGSKVKVKMAQIWLYDGNPDQPVSKQVQQSVGCIPNTFVQKYRNQSIESGFLPVSFYSSSSSTDRMPANYFTMDELNKTFTTSLKPGQTYSYLYGWKVIPDINAIFGKDGQPVGYCGGFLGDRKLFQYSKAYTPSGSCYLIPDSVKEQVQCCYNEDCRFAGSNFVCDPNTFTCTNKRPCNVNLDCQIQGEQICSQNKELNWNCDISQPWYPYKGTCINSVKDVKCCSDSDCNSNQYCDRTEGCKDRILPTIETKPSESSTPKPNITSSVFSTPKTIEPKPVGCIKLIDNGNTNEKLDLAFIADDEWELKEFQDKVSELINYNDDKLFKGLFSIEPLKSNKGKFNVWTFVSNSSLVLNNNGDSSTDYLKSLKNCLHADSFVVLSKKNFRSKAFLNGNAFVSLKNGVLTGRTLTHELGHSLFGLSDEYVEPSLGNHARYPNCAPNIEKAKEWWGELEGKDGVGYYHGCSYAEHNIRPLKATIMGGGLYTLTPQWGAVNSREILKVLDKYEE